MSQYCCPDCDKAVWHDCRPPSYWRNRRLRRKAQLTRLLRVELPPADYPTLEEAYHSAFADFAGGPGELTEDEARAATDGRDARPGGVKQ